MFLCSVPKWTLRLPAWLLRVHAPISSALATEGRKPSSESHSHCQRTLACLTPLDVSSLAPCSCPVASPAPA
eukprot:9498167-Pyramimonas_sp.AAC.1